MRRRPRSRGAKGGRDTRLPYTSAYVSALQMGLTSEDLRTMPWRQLVYMLDEWDDMNTPEKDRVRWATQEDIDKFLR